MYSNSRLTPYSVLLSHIRRCKTRSGIRCKLLLYYINTDIVRKVSSRSCFNRMQDMHTNNLFVCEILSCVLFDSLKEMMDTWI
jgi:hypothetical protein